MTVPMERDFDPAENFPSVVMDALQRMLSSGFAAVPVPIRIKPGSANTLQVPADEGQDAIGIPIEGRWRWIEAAVEQAGSGSAGLKDVWACADESVYTPGSPGEDDDTDRSFVLRITAAEDSAPAGFDLTRKVAQAYWDGSQFLGVAPIVAGVGGSTDKLAGKCIVATEETRTNESFGLLSTPDRVRSIVMPTDGLLQVWYQALWARDTSTSGIYARLYLNDTPVQAVGASGSSSEIGCSLTGVVTANQYKTLATSAAGLATNTVGNHSSAFATTGHVVGMLGEVTTVTSSLDVGLWGGPLSIFAAAGTYDVSVRFASFDGAVKVKDRRLWVRALSF